MSEENIYLLISRISAGSILIPFVTAVLFFKRYGVVLRGFSTLIFFSLLAEGLGTVLSVYRINNLPYLHFYTLVEFGLYLFFYYRLLNSYKLNMYFYAAAILFIAAFVFNMMRENGLNNFNTVARTFEAFVLTVFSLYYFYTVMRDEEFVQLEKSPYFWINTGVLLYFMGNFFMFMLYNVIMNQSYEMTRANWNIHSLLNIIVNILFAIGLSCKTQGKK